MQCGGYIVIRVCGWTRDSYRLVGFFEWACHIKNVDILGGTPTWDLDVPVHGTVTNSAHLQM